MYFNPNVKIDHSKILFIHPISLKCFKCFDQINLFHFYHASDIFILHLIRGQIQLNFTFVIRKKELKSRIIGLNCRKVKQ
jgi:hypothetical protein